MRRNRRPIRGGVAQVLLFIVSSVLLLAVIALVGANMWLRKQYEPTLEAFRRDLTQHVDLFCEQQAKLAADPWFHEPRTAGDAGPLLNTWLEWDPGPAMPADSPLQLPAALAEKKDWKELVASEVDVSTLDFGWMRQLQTYDRWDIVKDTPFSRSKPFNLTTAPIPNYIILQTWAKLRLVHGLRTGQPMEAARDVRHLAWLAYRSDTLLGAMIGAALLRIENRAHASMEAPPPEWRPMSLDQIERMRAVFFASMAFSSVATPTDVARKARHCGSGISRCTGLTEASIYGRYLKSLAEDSYRPAYDALAAELASAPCPTSAARTIWEHGAMIDDTPPSGSEAEWLLKLPGGLGRKHVAGILMANGTQQIDRLKELPDASTAPASANTTP
ncbi:hypothetical protein HPC49_24195 [Pyxidicoccus fallax]|uniref:Uncharacterized protein n=1 Tax=Pyxidicoccus fallax TaxID=394095 RepID=A0A848LAI7_9BACT|nr:hypothetical protein [Pyxidicoccus fallax]NMO15909.1 hypothetical protein [Pyxidicoccus fallax]NPC81317.1 hypothetical protein [Pyxidicoccus fallax]